MERGVILWIVFDLRNGSDEAIAAPGNRFDVERRVKRIAKCVAQVGDRHIEAVIEVNEGIRGPEKAIQLISRDQFARIFQQIDQDEERLFAELDGQTGAAQFHSSRVDFEDTEMPAPSRAYGRGH